MCARQQSKSLAFFASLTLLVVALAYPRGEAHAEELYTVQPGDSLARIAARHRTTVAALAVANRLGDANTIRVGQSLTIPSAPTASAATAANRTRNNSAAAAGAQLPLFGDFVGSVSDGQAGVVRGVYVPGVLAHQIAQQPAAAPDHISSAAGVATQFAWATYFNVTGFLAHNHLAGADYFDLAPGQEVSVVYGDGTVRRYLVSHVYRYQAVDPDNPSSALVDLNSGIKHSAGEVFALVYTGAHHVTFQTCIAKDGVPVWGRLFVTAIPLS